MKASIVKATSGPEGKKDEWMKNTQVSTVHVENILWCSHVIIAVSAWLPEIQNKKRFIWLTLTCWLVSTPFWSTLKYLNCQMEWHQIVHKNSWSPEDDSLTYLNFHLPCQIFLAPKCFMVPKGWCLKTYVHWLWFLCQHLELSVKSLNNIQYGMDCHHIWYRLPRPHQDGFHCSVPNNLEPENSEFLLVPHLE